MYAVDVTVAPDTMSMSALWASTTSRLRMGTARLLASTSRGLRLGTCTAAAVVTLPSATVIWTWTGP